MKQIVIKIDERLFPDLIKLRDFRRATEDCFEPPSDMDKIVMAMLDKIEQGKDELEIGIKGKPLE